MRLIATDMDGTLLDNNHNLPNEFGDILEELKENKVLFTIATGRNYLDISKKLGKYKDDLLFICENGAGIFYKDECIFANFLDKTTISKVLKIAKNIDDAYPVLCGTKALYLDSQEGIELINKHFPVNMPIVKVDRLVDVDDGIFTINMFDMKSAELNSYNYFKDYKIENVSFIPSGYYWLDIISSNVNKGTAIKNIQSLYNIPFEETMVFGDFINDLEMMEVAKYSYAMKNGHELVKKAANFETKYTNDENGVIQTIKEYIPAKSNA
ncbi:MAG: HAD family hydrolase [Peptostreptococcaceae bacterium]